MEYNYHYVYRITNVVYNKHYYGVRSCNCKPEEDLGEKYFSSSSDKEFLLEQKECPERYTYKVVSKYLDRNEALLKEIKLHAYFEVGINVNFYNRCKQTITRFDPTGVKHTPERKLNQSKAKLGKKRKPHSEATKLKMRNAALNRKFSDEHKSNLSKASKGKKKVPFSDKHKENIAIARRNAPPRVFSEQARKNMSIAAKRRNQG